MNEAKLREYAELIVKIGANVQKGQRVRLQAGVDLDIRFGLEDRRRNAVAVRHGVLRRQHRNKPVALQNGA